MAENDGDNKGDKLPDHPERDLDVEGLINGLE